MKRNLMGKYLKLTLVIALLACIVLFFVIVPNVITDLTSYNAIYDVIYIPALIFIWFTTIPVFIAFYKFWIVFSEIGRDNSFCERNARALRDVSFLASLDSVLYFIALIIALVMNLYSTGILIIALFIIFAGLIFAVLCAALSHLVEKAAALKSENDLTI